MHLITGNPMVVVVLLYVINKGQKWSLNGTGVLPFLKTFTRKRGKDNLFSDIL